MGPPAAPGGKNRLETFRRRPQRRDPAVNGPGLFSRRLAVLTLDWTGCGRVCSVRVCIGAFSSFFFASLFFSPISLCLFLLQAPLPALGKLRPC